MYVHNLSETLLQLGPISIRFYGLVYAFAFLFYYFYLKKLQKLGKIRLKEEEVENLLIISFISMLIGARLMHAYFYNFSYYISRPLEVFMIWKGGLSFFGALIGILIGSTYYLRKKEENFWKIADYIALPLPFFLSLGRVANFLNRELYGFPTSLPWCVVFYPGDVCRHPSQLYEALAKFLLGTTLLAYYHLSYSKNENHEQGKLFTYFLLGYGLTRFTTNFFRAEPLIFGLNWGQWFSLILIAIALFLLSKFNNRK